MANLRERIIMGRLEVQGIVSAKDGMPRVQFRQLNDEGELEAGWETEIIEAREMSQQVLEAAMNAVYDAAIVAWAKEMWPEDEMMGPRMLMLIRDYRADHWGLPDQPKDWRND
jgi:hypothetical protein